MNALKNVFYELIGLFVDDGSLALEILAIVSTAAISHFEMPNMPLVAGGILLLGCLGVLLVNVRRSSADHSHAA